MNDQEQPLACSPLDRVKSKPSSDFTLYDSKIQRWKPSRFNVQVTTDEGWLLLWNTCSGALNAFRPSQGDKIRNMLSQFGFDSVKNGICGYLVDRGYLVLADSDELRKVQYAAGIEHCRSDVLELILLASEDCNFRCTYCYEHFKRGTMQPHVREGIKHLVNNRLNTLRQLKVSWFGGEPLYGMKAIEDLAPFFAKVAADHDLKFASHMTTDAYLLSENVVDRLFLWGINDFQVTVDGMPEDHDSHRPTRDGRGTFQTIFDNILAMKQRTEDFTVVIRVNFDRKNSGRLEEFLGFVQKTFQNDDRFMVSFHAVGKWGGPNDAELITCGLEVLRRVATLPRVRKIVQIGYRGITLNEERQLGAKATVITTAHARSITASGLLALIPNDCRCYISIDIDVIDPLFAPGTSAPVPDGLSPSTITRMLQAIVKQRHIAGIDLMEVNPSLDENDATSRISAELIAAIAQNWAY